LDPILKSGDSTTKRFRRFKIGKGSSNKKFRGVFMKDELPQKINKIECGIINLENSD
jgi:hypothetical protein